MTTPDPSPPSPNRVSRKFNRRHRLMIYLGVLLLIAAWKFLPRPWTPSDTVATARYNIFSTATREQAEQTGLVLEMLYRSYSNRLGQLPRFRPPAEKLEVKLYRDRDQFRWVNPGLGWAEAFYRKPYCQAYYSTNETNPYHWMVHEAVHQLNEEVAHLDLAKWLEEGLAEYFSTCRRTETALELGTVDPETYPIWWLPELATKSDLNENLRNGSVIPLRAIITNRGGPSMRRHVNLYYLHWWALTHYVFEHHPAQATQLLEAGGGLDAFERLIGPVEEIQTAWHAHVQRLKKD